jgi:hypothetical protein
VVRDFLIDLVRSLTLPGGIAALGSVLYLVVQLTEYVAAPKLMKAIYFLRSFTINEIRAYLTLPGLSVVVAIVAGVGVNLATSGDSGDNLQTGLWLIAAAVFLAFYGGFTLLLNSEQGSSKSYDLQLRLSRVSDALGEPFVPVEQARQLIPEIRRYEAVGQRLIKRAETFNYRQWFKINVSRKGRRDIRIGYTALFSLIPLSAIHLMLAGWDTYAVIMPVAWVVVAACCGGLAPRIHFINVRRRHAFLGKILATRSARIMRKISALERTRADHRGVKDYP